MADQPRRVDLADVPGGERAEVLAQIGRAGQAAWQRRPGCRQVGARDDLEVRRPILLRQWRGLVPVIGRAVEQQPRPVPGLEMDEAVGDLGKRCPDLERSVRLEGVGPVVLEHRLERARVHQQALVPADLQGGGRALAQRRQVRAEQGGERLVAYFRDDRG